MSKQAILGVLFSSLLFTSSYAANEASDVVDVASILDGEGHARILFHWDSPIDAEHFAIRRALLKFEVAGQPEPRVLRVCIHPVTSAWRAADVFWSGRWSQPGGDYDVDIMSSADIDLENGSSTALTNVLKDVFEQDQPFFGFLVTADPADGIGLKEGDVSRFEGLASATIEVSWRKTPPKPAAVQ
jgi:hypothetical protein